MAYLDQPIYLEDLPESSGNYELLPAGWYNCTIGGAELKNTKNGTGQLIAVKYSITGPTHQGRVVFGNINIRNQSTKAEEMGRQRLRELMSATGIFPLTNTDQFIGQNLSIRVAIQEAKTDAMTGETYDARNEVKGFKALSGAMPAASTVPRFAKPADTPKPAGSEPPWAKK